VDYIIPGNDDAIGSINLYTRAVADAILDARLVLSEAATGAQDEFVELDGSGDPVVTEGAAGTDQSSVATKAKAEGDTGDTGDTAKESAPDTEQAAVSDDQPAAEKVKASVKKTSPATDQPEPVSGESAVKEAAPKTDTEAAAESDASGHETPEAAQRAE
jgi:small subunit ribosomal protein S2